LTFSSDINKARRYKAKAKALGGKNKANIKYFGLEASAEAKHHWLEW